LEGESSLHSESAFYEMRVRYSK